MAAPAALVQLFEPWAELYGNSSLLPTLVVFGHIAALVVAGGTALTLDRDTLRAAHSSAEARWRQLDALASAHRLVLRGIAISVVTGALLFASDVATYFGSWIYWTKMALIVLLLGNGYLMTRTESRIRLTPNAADDAGWARLRQSATFSTALWFATAFAGVALVNSG